MNFALVVERGFRQAFRVALVEIHAISAGREFESHRASLEAASENRDSFGSAG